MTGEHSCAGCQVCCDLIPVVGLSRAFQGCPHRRSVLHREGPGCSIYSTRPEACQVWHCQWRKSDDWPDELKPSLCGIVVDEALDLIRVRDTKGGAQELPAAQIWVSPGYEEAYLGPHVAAMIRRLLDTGVVILWRLPDAKSARVMLPSETGFDVTPSFLADKADKLGGEFERQRRVKEIMRERGQ